MGKTTNTQKEQRKAKIREKIKNANTDDIQVIPADPIESVENSTSIHRVAAYCRVSTDEDTQTTSFELQKSTYTEMITQHPGWELAGIYADEGISGTSFNHRLGMQQMLEDCKAGKIDMIITKSIARFARNIVDCLDTIEMLKSLPHPVGVQFETEHLYTLDDSGRMILAILSTVAEEESHSKSLIMNWSVENRFSKGLFLTPPLYGYDKDPETDKLVINPEEAKVVRLCFFLYLSGFTFESIAETLTGLGIQTFTGKDIWNPGTIRGMLQNERHYGAVLAHKTFTPSFLTHKAKKNSGQRKRYFKEDDHKAIVSKTVFMAVQKKMRAESSAGAPIPSLSVVDAGILKGYVPVNLKYDGFTGDDFLEATGSVCGDALPDEEEPAAQTGIFMLDDFQIVRSEFFSCLEKPVMTLNGGAVSFNTACMRKFGDVEYVELLVNAREQCIAIRPCGEDNPNAVRWGRLKDSRWYTSPKSCRGLIEPVFGLMEWDRESRYQLHGQYLSEGTSQVLLFDLSSPSAARNESGEYADAPDETVVENPEISAGPGDTEFGDAPEPEKDPSFGEPALFGVPERRSLLFGRYTYGDGWEILRPARFYKYCADITREEVLQIKQEAQELLKELKEAR